MRQQVEVFPNPSEEYGTITLRADHPILDIQLWNLEGQSIQPPVQGQRSLSATVTGLESGIYVLQILTSGGSSHKRILVR